MRAGRLALAALAFALATSLPTGTALSKSKGDRSKSKGASEAEKRTVQTREQEKFAQSVRAERDSVAKTQGLLADKLAVRSAEMKKRVRALYKLSRGSFPRLWVEPEERRKVSQWLGAARRITTRDKEEIRLLHQEIDLANAAEARLKAIEDQRLSRVIEPGSLLAPLAKTRITKGFGEYQGPSRRLRLRQRGALLKAKQGEEVRAVAPGRVLYVGGISGQGEAVLLEHEGFTSLVSRLQPASLELGDSVPAGGLLGHASQTSVYLEIRLRIGSVGQAVDPEPLLGK